MTAAYGQLEARFARLSALSDAIGVLGWDMAVMMPRGGAAARSGQIATLRLMRHEIVADPAMGDLLAAAEAGAGALDDWQRANLAEMRRAWVHATAVPGDLVDAFSRACSESDMAWREARPANDFATMRPHLEGILGLVREIASRKAEALGTTPYDALLDEFEPDGRAADIDRVFEPLAAFLPGLIDRVLERQAAAPAVLPLGDGIATERQRALGLRVMEMLGFPFEHGRLDTSAHPFSGGVPDDLRITTRFTEHDVTDSLMAVIHETGHALYEHQLPRAWRGQPVGEARGMALHESQSLLLEMQAARSRPFVDVLAPLARDVLGVDGPAWQADNLYRHFTRVARSFIRVEADEVTYPVHVILRYRLERTMVDGRLDVADLPEAWNAGMRDLLGVAPPDDRRGCLQDVHWYDGAWGYFPTYTLGAMMAAQVFEAALRADAAIGDGIARGDFRPLLAWLAENVHGFGASRSTEGILTRATGRPLDPDCFRSHLERRYLDG